MSDSVHSPGPWAIDGMFDAEIAIEIYSEPLGRDSLPICELDPIAEEWSLEEIANAHLIRSAPELLQATREFLGYVHGGHANADGTTAQRCSRSRCRRLRELISRAVPVVAEVAAL